MQCLSVKLLKKYDRKKDELSTEVRQQTSSVSPKAVEMIQLTEKSVENSELILNNAFIF